MDTSQRPRRDDRLAYVVDPDAVCPPATTGTTPPVRWSETLALVVDGTCLGVRASSPVIGRLLRAGLEPFVADDLARRPQPNLSVVITPDDRHRRGAGFHFLQRGTTAVVRSRDPRRVVDALGNHLSAACRDATVSIRRVRGLALVRDGRAVVVPAELVQWLARIERRLQLAGFRLVDHPWVYLDAERCEVVVPQPRIVVAPEAARAIEASAPRRADPTVGPGRFPLAAWAFLVPPDDTGLSRAQALARAVTLSPTVGAADVAPLLDEFAPVMGRVEPVALPWGPPAELVRPLTELA